MSHHHSVDFHDEIDFGLLMGWIEQPQLTSLPFAGT